jgi:hypothetical protein
MPNLKNSHVITQPNCPRASCSQLGRHISYKHTKYMLCNAGLIGTNTHLRMSKYFLSETNYYFLAFAA